MSQLRDMTPAEIAACAPASSSVTAPAAASGASAAGAGASSSSSATTGADVMDVEAGGDDDVGGKKKGAASNGPVTLLPALVDKLKGYIRSGVGLPTRGATARFICTLVNATGDLMTPQAAGLNKTLLAALEDGSPTLRREFAAAAAHVVRIAKPATVTKVIARVAELAQNPEDAGARATAGYLVLQLSKHASERAKTASPELIPIAFLGRHDPDEGARSVWAEAWEGLAASTEQQLRLFASEVVAAIASAIDHSGWVVKKQGGDALVTLLRTLTRASDFRSITSSSSGAAAAGADVMPVVPVADYRPGPGGLKAASASATTAKAASSSISSSASVAATYVTACLTQHSNQLRPTQCPEMTPHAQLLVPKLLAALPGRVWEGKEALATALAELTTRTASAFTAPASVAAPTPSETAAVGTPAVASSSPTAAGSNSSSSSGSALSAETVLRCLVPQAVRSNAPLPFATACAAGIALVCRAYPSMDACAYVSSALSPVLTRLGRPVQLQAAPADAAGESTIAATASGTPPGAPPPAGAATAAKTATLVGGKVNEEKEGEARAAAKEKDLEQSALACACLSAIAAAFPAILLRRSDDSSRAATVEASSSDVMSAAIAPFASAAAAADPSITAEVIAAGVRAQLAVHASAVATQRESSSPLLRALAARLAEVGLHTERVALLSAITVVLAKLDLSQAQAAASDAGQAWSVAVAEAANCCRKEDKFSSVRVAGLSTLLVALQRLEASGIALQQGAASSFAPSGDCLGAIAAAVQKHASGSDSAAAQVAKDVEALFGRLTAARL